MPYEIWNRRYTGSKYKLADWIFEIIDSQCSGNSFCDIFAGTGIIAKHAVERIPKVVVNDFLYSNEVVYKAFFMQSAFDKEKIEHYKDIFQSLQVNKLKENYISKNYGGKFFSMNDAIVIGEIRERIETIEDVNEKEKAILIASLLYSVDKIANTVGHYDAYIKGHQIQDQFKYDLISPYLTDSRVEIHREDANNLAKTLNCDIVYIDPPYNSRQYSRFYHVLENLTTWKKPELYGVALKPKPENMSEYCRSTALEAFTTLIKDLNCKYILVSYNNTYTSKSSSSMNKMTLDNIQQVLSTKGKLKCFEKSHPYFNAGKTSFTDHKELLFMVEVNKL